MRRCTKIKKITAVEREKPRHQVVKVYPMGGSPGLVVKGGGS